MSEPTTHPHDGDMPDELDFSKGLDGKFRQAGAKLPVYLDADVQTYLAAIASRKGVSLSAIANDLLKREIEIIEAVK